MSNQLPIQFLLHQLATNKQDRERFNLISDMEAGISFLHFISDEEELKNKKILRFGSLIRFEFEELNYLYQEKMIRTCLSRVNGEAVLKVFDKYTGDIAIDKINELYTKVQKARPKQIGFIIFGDYETYCSLNAELHYYMGMKQQGMRKVCQYLSLEVHELIDKGKSFDEALQTLHNKMLKLVPEYQEFLNNNI